MSISCCYYGYSVFTPVTRVVLRCCHVNRKHPQKMNEKIVIFYWFLDKIFTRGWPNQIQTWTSFQNICWNPCPVRWVPLIRDPPSNVHGYLRIVHHSSTPLSPTTSQSQSTCETLNKLTDTVTVRMTKVAHMSHEDIRSSLCYSHTSNDTSSHCCGTWAHTINLLPEYESNQPRWIKMYN